MSDKLASKIANAPDAATDELPPIAPNEVRPLTDPGAVERWRAVHEPANVVYEYNPFANDRIR